jgi:hypothetical protein
LTTQKKALRSNHIIRAYKYPKRDKISSIYISSLPATKISQKDWYETEDCRFVFGVGILKILGRLQNGGIYKIGDVATMKRGVLFDKHPLTPKKRNYKSHL